MTLPAALTASLADRYELLRELGRGGMATVYLARDVRHARQVAIKVLHPELAAVLGAERFLAEITTTANLQHPHILPLLDSGSADGQLFYVMPFVEGETLRARLNRETQLPIADAVQLAREVADALQYAHERGVIHRDIKPENILLHGGHALVADFGIALAVQQAGGQRMTQTGLSLGTPQYMAPEQAMGDKAVDARADIYALGAVTYEMLAGEPPFTGPSAQAIVARVLTVAPAPLSQIRNTIPTHLEHTVLMALAKLPADRFASARDFAVSLTAASNGTAHHTASARARRVGGRELVAWLVALASIGVVTWLATRPEPAQPVRRFTLVLPDSVTASGSPGGNLYSVAISRDGTLMAFVGTQRLRASIYLRRADESEAHAILGTEGGSRPVFSPDGRSLLFVGIGSELLSIPVTGGEPKRLADSVSGGTWSNDNTTIYFTNRGPSLWAIEAAGGTARVVATLDSTARSRLASVEVIPGTQRPYVALRKVVASDGVSFGSTVGIVDLRSGKIDDTGFPATTVQYSPPGLLLFDNAANALAGVRVDKRGYPIRESEITVASDVVPAAGTFSGATVRGPLDFATSHEGTLFYRQARLGRLPSTTITLEERGGSRRVIRNDGQRYDQPIVSPDGMHAVVRVGASLFNTGDLWVLDIASGAFTPLTRGNVSYRPSWSRDGRRILYLTGSPTKSAVHSRAWDGSGVDSVLVVNTPGIAEFAEGPRDGWSIYRTSFHRDILLVPTDSLASAASRPFIEGPANEMNPQLSPDGRLLAYTSDASGSLEVYVTAVPGTSARVPVSIGGGIYARWSADGSQLYYRAASELRVATIVERPELAVTRRDLALSNLPDDAEYNFAIMPNGALLTTPGAVIQRNTNTLSVVTGWPSLITLSGPTRAR